MNKEQNFKKTNNNSSAIFIFVGLILIILSLYFSCLNCNSFISWKETLLSIFSSFGHASLVLGIFFLIIETKNWREYFSDRLKDIVIKQEYLNSIETDTLRNLQIKVMKALCKNTEIDREGSFLNYFHENLHKYISEPYREDVSAEVIFKGTEGNSLCILDKVSYSCRKLGESIQKTVNWFPDKDEFVKVPSIKVQVKYPYNHPKSGQIETLSENQEALRQGISLDKYKEIDGLIVIITSEYLIQKERFQIWEMAHSTKNFDITITYPQEYEIQYKPLVLNPDICQITKDDGYLKITYDSWMLPRSGIAWRIFEKKKKIS